MMGRIVAKAVREAAEDQAASRCCGRDDPDSRCPNPVGECVCAWVSYRESPWWRKFFREAPPRPSKETVVDNMIRLSIEERK